MAVFGLVSDYPDDWCYSIPKLCSTLCSPVDCSPPDSSTHGKTCGVGCHILLQGIFLIQGLNHVCCFAGRFFTTEPLGKTILMTTHGLSLLDQDYIKCVLTHSFFITIPPQIFICYWNLPILFYTLFLLSFHCLCHLISFYSPLDIDQGIYNLDFTDISGLS